MSSSILIVEDDALFAEDTSQVLKSNGYEVCGIAYDPVTALQILKNEFPDLILVDINLNHELDGIEFINIIKDKYNIPFIFLSAYSEQSVIERAKKTKPWGYILKPFNEKDLLITIELVLYKSKSSKMVKSVKGENKSTEEEDLLSEYVFVKKNNMRVKIKTSEIKWVEAESNYSNIITETGTYTVSLTLRKIEEKIGFDNLIRIHRKYLVNVDKIDVITPDYIKIQDYKIPIGNSYRTEIRKRLLMI